MKEFTDVVLGTATDIAKMVRSLLASRTTWIMALGFVAIYVSSGKIEAVQQLLAYLGLGATWVIKMGAQNIVGQIKNNGVPAPKPAIMPAVASTVAPATPKVEVQAEVGVEIPFDKDAFNSAITGKVVGLYGTDNPCARFYTARDYLFKEWYFNNMDAFRAGADEVLRLGQAAFTHIWKMSYDEALHYKPKKEECIPQDIKSWARQQSMGHYVALLDLQRVMKWHTEATE